MQAFEVHDKIVKDYKAYLKSFNIIKDQRINKVVEEAFRKDEYIPEPLIQFNPSFKKAIALDSLVKEGILNADLNRVFKGYQLYTHQEQAIRNGASGKSFIVTSGTGSGKSLTFLGTIFNHLFRNPGGSGIKAILVYPMNALINSQEEEIKKYAANYGPDFPITFRKYTGQESAKDKEEVESDLPDILLTNYMMLELLLTRGKEESMRKSIAENLHFLVFDELHTYRGRQGSDVSLLIRRLKSLCKNKIISIGTSATMASGDHISDEKQVVAGVASEIFGEKFEKDQIIGETLETVTESNSKLPSPLDLQEVMTIGVNKSGSEEEFRKHPFAIWLEREIALTFKDDGTIKRAKPKSLKEIVIKLSRDAKIEDHETCLQYLKRFLEWSEALNIKNAANRQSFLPFKIHQFISQTGNVYVTLDSRKKREITLEDGRYIKDGGEERYIFPVLFSRYSGMDFICVKKNFSEGRLEPREPDSLPQKITKSSLKGDREEGRSKRVLKDSDFEQGYLILSEGDEDVWSPEMIESLPDTWWKDKRGVPTLENYYEFRVPQKIYFNSEGSFSNERVPGLNLSGWFVSAPMLFDPTCGVVYDPRTRENTKLMKVGNVGKSTATTITTFSILKAQYDQRVKVTDQKVMSFTDNRQDASLQTGHFNDFLMIGRLRSSIYRALKNAPGQKLTMDTISTAVFKELKLEEVDYARNPSSNPKWPDEENEKALVDFLKVRILYDLRRGWRYNTPNLEQCALLDITYSRLQEYCEEASFFDKDELLSIMSPSERENFVLQILNYFRTAYAFNYYLLDEEARPILEERLRQKLNASTEWSLDQDERLERPPVLIYERIGKIRRGVYTESIGPTSNLGKYLTRVFAKKGLPGIKGAPLGEYIQKLCKTLQDGHFLSSIPVEGEKGKTLGYQLKVDKIIWKLGDGENILTDEVRINMTGEELKVKPNQYFKSFYQQDFKAFDKFFRASEHTGQISSGERIEREDKFRSGEISALYCSPTMELGIDIANLSIVHMRNVPPNPANYAQRSGRAGRSGQTALVFTYCSNTSPHDRHFFKNSIDMVAGSVKAPRIDLLNEELIISHFNAYIFMHLGLTSINSSVRDFLDLEEKKSLPIRTKLADHFKDQKLNFQSIWIEGFKKVIKDKFPELAKSKWFGDEWLQVRASQFYTDLDRSFDRWRTLFKNASKMIEKATVVMNDPTYAKDSKESKEASRLVNIGRSQRDILLNEQQIGFRSDSEFYVYRYLAAEGFLPGYNFTRLPVRAFIGKRSQDEGTFISRPRFIALKEFGPGNLIYHNGGKFRVTRMQLSDSDARLEKIKISTKTGYAWLGEEGTAINNDPITHEALKGQTNALTHSNLLELVETDTWPQERISSEEEERMSSGYEIEQYFHYPKGIESTQKTILKASGADLMNILFCPATQLIQVNKKWKSSKEEEGEESGFLIGRVSGKWLKKSDLELQEEREKDPSSAIHLYTTDTADSLYIQPIAALGLSEEGVISLTFALKRAIEQVFQIEESEVGVWFMGSKESPNILIYEAAEGSLGILSQITQDPERLREVFREAYKMMHFDPETKEDLAPDQPKASYDDLLSYYNQRYHEKLDRFSIQKALELLMICEVDNTGSGNSGHTDREGHFQELMARYDKNSEMERKLIEYLYTNDYVLPDKAQVELSGHLGFYISADFVFLNTDKTIKSVIFCDGSVHDNNQVREDDSHKRTILRDRGIDVIEWHYSEPIPDLINRRKDVFRRL